MEIIAGVVLGLTAAVVGVWRISTRDRPIHGPPDGQFSIPNIQRWSDTTRPRRFASLRRVMPRFDLSGIVLVVGLLLLVIVVVVGSVAYINNRNSAPSAATVENRLGGIVSQHADANAATDPAIAYELLIDARDATESFIGEFPDGQVDPGVLEEYGSILADIDSLTRVSRLETIQPVGGVPPAPSDVLPQLFTGDGKVFLLTDALYQVDTTTTRLVRLLGEGDVIGETVVGKLSGAAWRSDGPLAIDGQAAYVLNLTSGQWIVEPLGHSEEFPDVLVTAIDVFDFNLYVLDRTAGRILKYAGGDYASPPEDWTGGQASGDLVYGTDMFVDGNIYVSMIDGRILNFFLSNLNNVYFPEIVPPFEDTEGLTASPNGAFLYIVNASDGRIARLDWEGNLIQQFVSGSTAASLTGISDIVVNEETGIAFVLVADTMYTTRLPGPPAGP